MMTSMHAEPSELVDQGRAALRADDATAARRAFVAAREVARLRIDGARSIVTPSEGGRPHS